MKHPHPIPPERLEKLSTHRLLQLVKMVRTLWQALWLEGQQDTPFIWVRKLPGESEEAYEKRYAQATFEWTTRKESLELYRENVKRVLATREHLPRKESVKA